MEMITIHTEREKFWDVAKLIGKYASEVRSIILFDDFVEVRFICTPKRTRTFFRKARKDLC